MVSAGKKHQRQTSPRDFFPKASMGFDVSDVGSWGRKRLVVFVVFLFSTSMNGEIAAKRGKYLMYICKIVHTYHISIISHITCIYIYMHLFFTPSCISFQTKFPPCWY